MEEFPFPRRKCCNEFRSVSPDSERTEPYGKLTVEEEQRKKDQDLWQRFDQSGETETWYMYIKKEKHSGESGMGAKSEEASLFTDWHQVQHLSSS